MALSSSPPISLSAIKGELGESTMSGTKTLGNCHDYIFGSGTRNQLDFLGYGIPTVSSLSLSSGNGSLTCNFTVNNDGNLSLFFVAQYWEATADVNPSPYFEQQIGNGSGTGAESHDLTGLNNGTQYEVRVTAYNKFNNSGNYPAPRGTNQYWDWTNTETGTPQQPQLSTPSLSGQTVNYSGIDVYLAFGYTDNETSFSVQYRINGGTTQGASIQCTNNVGTSNSNKEIVAQIGQFLGPGDTLEMRIRANGSGGTADSNWSAWETASNAFVPNCPL